MLANHRHWTSTNQVKRKKPLSSPWTPPLGCVIWLNKLYADVSVCVGTQTWRSTMTKALDSHLSFFMSALIFISKLSLCVYDKLCRMTSKLRQAQQHPRWFCQRQALFWLTWQSCTHSCASGKPWVSPPLWHWEYGVCEGYCNPN